jgi:Mycothiol maleylpyruvate isomerase N-terminal domain
MTEIHEQLALAAGEAARLARNVDASQLDDPTPCLEYDVRDLAAHLMQEIVLHGWDLAVATGQAPKFPDEVAATVLRWLDNDKDPNRGDDWYDAPVATDSTSLLDRAVAKSGRDPSDGNPSTTSQGSMT